MTDGDQPKKPTEVISPQDWQQMSDEERRYYSVLIEGFQSPLLPPEVLERYGEVIPGLDVKLVDWSEQETEHRRQLERDAFEEAKTLRSRASIAGPAVSISGILMAGLLATLNQTASGAVAASVIAIVAVGGPFAARILAARFQGSSQEGPDSIGTDQNRRD